MLQYSSKKKSLAYVNTLSLSHSIKLTIIPLYAIHFQVYPIDLNKSVFFKLVCSNQDPKSLTCIWLLCLIHLLQSGELLLPFFLSHAIVMLKKQGQLSYRISDTLELPNDFLCCHLKIVLCLPISYRLEARDKDLSSAFLCFKFFGYLCTIYLFIYLFICLSIYLFIYFSKNT